MNCPECWKRERQAMLAANASHRERVAQLERAIRTHFEHPAVKRAHDSALYSAWTGR